MQAAQGGLGGAAQQLFASLAGGMAQGTQPAAASGEGELDALAGAEGQ